MTILCDECNEQIILPTLCVEQGNNMWHYKCYQAILKNLEGEK